MRKITTSDHFHVFLDSQTELVLYLFLEFAYLFSTVPPFFLLDKHSQPPSSLSPRRTITVDTQYPFEDQVRISVRPRGLVSIFFQ